MTSIYVRDVSENALTTLKVRAARAGQSLQAYIRQLLEAEATTLTPEEAVDQARTIAARSSVTADDTLGAIAEMRQARQNVSLSWIRSVLQPHCRVTSSKASQAAGT